VWEWKFTAMAYTSPGRIGASNCTEDRGALAPVSVYRPVGGPEISFTVSPSRIPYVAWPPVEYLTNFIRVLLRARAGRYFY
jgi:hypothetical protein